MTVVTFVFIFLMFVSLVIQHFVGALPGPGSQILLMQIVFLCGASALPLWNMLILAFIGGIMWDCLTFLPMNGRSELPFGGTVLIYAGLGSLMNGLRPLFQRGLWQVHVLTTGVLIALLVLLEYVIITFRREPFALIWPPQIWIRISGSGAAAAIIAVPLFLLLNWMGRRSGVFDEARSSR